MLQKNAFQVKLPPKMCAFSIGAFLKNFRISVFERLPSPLLSAALDERDGGEMGER
jgi:hypothetical protein